MSQRICKASFLWLSYNISKIYIFLYWEMFALSSPRDKHELTLLFHQGTSFRNMHNQFGETTGRYFICEGTDCLSEHLRLQQKKTSETAFYLEKCVVFYVGIISFRKKSIDFVIFLTLISVCLLFIHRIIELGTIKVRQSNFLYVTKKKKKEKYTDLVQFLHVGVHHTPELQGGDKAAQYSPKNVRSRSNRLSVHRVTKQLLREIHRQGQSANVAFLYIPFFKNIKNFNSES